MIKMAKLKAWALDRRWKDRHMGWVFDWGWADLTERRPAVMPFSPNMDAAYARYAKVCAAHKLELDRKWSRASQRIPYARRLHIVQTNAVDKSDDSARLIGNATHPELGTLLDTFLGVPIAPNTNTDWSRLPHFEWASVDRFAEAMAVLCAVTVH